MTLIQNKSLEWRDCVCGLCGNFQLVDVICLITKQLNWSHTQFVCASIGHVHSVYVGNIKEVIIIVIII